MIKNATLGSSSQLGGLYSGVTKPNDTPEDYISFIPPDKFLEKKKQVVSLPQSLALEIRRALCNGKFKFFGIKVKAQKKGYEAVWWLLSDIYRKTILRDRKEVHLLASAMEDRYGKDNGKGSLITWYTLTDFCLQQGWIDSDDSYLTGRYTKSFWLKEDITDCNDCVITISETVIINKLNKEINRYEKNQLQAWMRTSRNQSIEITKKNLTHLRFDETELDKVCKNFLFISLTDIKEWVKMVRKDTEAIFPYPLFQQGDPLSIGIRIGSIMQRYIEYISIVFPPFTNNNSITKLGSKSIGKTGRKIKSRKKTQQEKENLRRKQLFSSIIYLLLDMDERSVFVDNKGGRLYSPITNLKKDARKALRYINGFKENEALINFDVKTCQPWVLGITILMDCKRKGIRPHADVERYLRLIETSDFYYAIVDSFQMHLKYINSGNPTEEDLKGAREKARDEAKKGVMQDFYSNMYYSKKSNVPNNDPTKPAGRFVAKEFPAVWQWILDNKGTGTESEVPVMMQRLEADYFIDTVIPGLTSMGIWCLTIHDSVLVRKKDAKAVREFLRESMLNFFGRLPIVCEEALSTDNTELKKPA